MTFKKGHNQVEDYFDGSTKMCHKCKKILDIKEFNKQLNRNCEYDSLCRKCKKKTWITSKYKIDIEKYYDIYNSQEGKCKICYVFYPTLYVDHSHEDNKIRGLLCMKCNCALGLFKDNKEILNNAIEYLKNR